VEAAKLAEYVEEARLLESQAEEAAAAAEAAVTAAAAVAATAAAAAAAASTAAAAAAAASRAPTPLAAVRVPIPTAAVAAVRARNPAADAVAQRASDGYVLLDEEVRELRTALREDSSNGGGAGAGGGKAKAASFAAVSGGLQPPPLQRSKTLQAREMEALASMRLAEVDVRHRLVRVKRELQRSMSASAVAVAKDDQTLTLQP